MSNLRGAGTVDGAGRGSLFAALLPLAGLLAACGGGGGGASDGSDEGDLFVLAGTPTNGQETLTDLSDPGLDGKLTVRFTVMPRERDIIDNQNSFNNLTPYVQILNQGMIRVPGNPFLDYDTKSITFTPAGSTLSAAQYTATFSKFIASASGDLLNQGLADFSTSWTVGPDIYSPVVRNVTPAPLQLDTPLFTPIVITMNESLNPASVVLNQTVFVEDGGTNPPTAILGTVALARDGFDIVFTPDPCIGMPPATTVVFRMYGVGNTSFVRDRVGNGLVGDPTNSNQYSFQFNTKGVKQLPNPFVTPFPGFPRAGTPRYSPRFWTAAYASTGTTTYAFDMAPVSFVWSVLRVYDPSLTVQVLAANRTYRIILGVWTQVGPFGGDFEAKLGQPGEAVVDWRDFPLSGQSYIYQIDEGREAIAIINTGTGKVEGHLNGVGTPKGIAMGGSGGSDTNLYVTNFGQGTVTMIPVTKIIPGLPICTAVQELNDNPSNRRYMLTGNGPTGISTPFDWTALGVVANAADNDMQTFDPQTLQPVDRLGYGTLTQHYPVGENPIDVVVTPYILGIGWFAYVVNQGGEDNPTGSISLWYNSSSIAPFNSPTGAVQGSITEGINIPGKSILDPGLPLTGFYVPNTAGDDVARIEVQVQGGLIFVTVQPKFGGSTPVGQNPTAVTITGRRNGDQTMFVALAGQGQVAVMQQDAGIAADISLFNLPGVRYVFSCWNN